jgi:hypothetical protein
VGKELGTENTTSEAAVERLLARRQNIKPSEKRGCSGGSSDGCVSCDLFFKRAYDAVHNVIETYHFYRTWVFSKK